MVSICVPAYKKPDFVTRLLDAVLLQDYKDIEVVITDDSPNDDIQVAIAPYVDQYFKAILEVWENKGYKIAETTAILLFPTWVISEETVKKAQHWLDVTGKDASYAMRRAVAEGRDTMVRALKARAADK